MVLDSDAWKVDHPPREGVRVDAGRVGKAAGQDGRPGRAAKRIGDDGPPEGHAPLHQEAPHLGHHLERVEALVVREDQDDVRRAGCLRSRRPGKRFADEDLQQEECDREEREDTQRSAGDPLFSTHPHHENPGGTGRQKRLGQGTEFADPVRVSRDATFRSWRGSFTRS